MKSTCPFCSTKNDSHSDRKSKFRFKDMFGVYIPFISSDLPNFKIIICSKCGKEYIDKNITLFGVPYKLRWVIPVLAIVLFIYMLNIANSRG